MTDQSNAIMVPNINRPSVVEWQGMSIEVRKQRGGSIYELYVNNVSKGLNRTDARSAFLLLGEYFGVEVICLREQKLAKQVEEEAIAPVVIKKKGQSKWA